MEIKSAPIELNKNMKSLLPHGVSKCSLSFSIREQGNIIKRNGFHLHPDRKERIEREIEIILESPHCEKFECWADLYISNNSHNFS